MGARRSQVPLVVGYKGDALRSESPSVVSGAMRLRPTTTGMVLRHCFFVSCEKACQEENIA